VSGEEIYCEKVFKDLVLESLNYQEWELGVLLGSGGVGGMLLSDFLHSVQCSCSRCRIVDFTLISSRVCVHQVFNALPIEFGFIK
jgi:hypothetical protein